MFTNTHEMFAKCSQNTHKNMSIMCNQVCTLCLFMKNAEVEVYLTKYFIYYYLLFHSNLFIRHLR